MRNDFRNHWRLVYAILDKHNEAIEDFSKVINLNPISFFEAYYRRAIEYAALRIYPKAIADMEEYISTKGSAMENFLEAKYYEEGKRLLDEWERLLDL